MDEGHKFIMTDFLPALIVGQWVSVVEDVTNIFIYIVVSVITKVVLNLMERRSNNAKL